MGTGRFRLYSYEDIKAEPEELFVKQINAYLVDANNILLDKSKNHISANAPLMFRGSQATDGGNLLLSNEEKRQLLLIEPQAEKWIKRFLMGDEFINGIDRWCLWMQGITPTELRAMPQVCKRVEAVSEMRLNSPKVATQKLATTAYLFGEIKQPKTRYLALPSVSSERRNFIPIDYLEADVICGNKIYCLPNASYFDFGILNSTMHMAWMRAVCGRLESRYNYSITVVYNNFAFPLSVSDADKKNIENLSQLILTARSLYPNATLADLYDPITMPIELIKAHKLLDKAVDKAYGYKGNDDDANRVAFMFKLYEQLTSLLPSQPIKKTKVKHKGLPNG